MSVLTVTQNPQTRIINIAQTVSLSTSTTTDLAEGTNLYHTVARVRATVLTGLSTALATTVAATHTVLEAIGFLQKQNTDNLATLTTHTGNVANPHATTKAHVGLGSADNTSDVAKPVSTAQAAADALAQPLAGKDASGGYAGLTLFRLNLKNAANTITSWFTTAATVARTWTMPDKDGTVAMTSDLTGLATLANNNFAGVQNFARVTVASTALANIWGVSGNQIDWTGTVTCTGFSPPATQSGAERVLICAAAAPFTAGPDMLIDGVASGVTLVCAANDTVIVRAVTTTQFKLSRVRYDGAAGLGSNIFTGSQISAVTALTSTAASIAINLAANNNFSHATTENTTLAAPSNPVAGQTGMIVITQGATARTLAYNAFWKFPAGVIPALTAAVSAVDSLTYYVESATRATCQLIKDVK